MRIRILFVLAVPALVVYASGPSASQSDQPQTLPIQELFDKALAAEGNEYIELRSELIERKSALSFLKAKMADKDWKTAILAEAMLARITEPQRYLRYEQILKDAADKYFSSSARVPRFGVGDLEEKKKRDRAIPFLLELALKDSVACLDYTKPAFALEFLEKYFSEDFGIGEDELYYEFLASGCDHLKGIVGIEGLSPEQRTELCELVRIMEKDMRARALFRYYATIRLGSFTHPAAQPALIELLRLDDNSQIRRYAAERITDPNAAAHLRAALQDDHPMVREAAALALGKLVDAESVDALIATLKDKNPVVRNGAATALGQIGDPNAVDTLVRTLKEFPENAIAVSLGKIDLDTLLSLLAARGSDPNVPAATIIWALGHLKDVRAVPDLLVTLRDEDRIVRDFSAEVLGRIGDRRAVAPLIDALRRDDHLTCVHWRHWKRLLHTTRIMSCSATQILRPER
jgi:HEAT repeat protein